MLLQSTAWDAEIERRIRIYEELEASGRIPGRLGIVDYVALFAIVIVLACGFWLWGGV